MQLFGRYDLILASSFGLNGIVIGRAHGLYVTNRADVVAAIDEVAIAAGAKC